MNPRRVAADFGVFSRGYLRNPFGLFFSLIFPLILIGIFGLIYSNSAAPTITVYAENLDHQSNASVAFLAALNGTGAVTVQVIDPSVVGNFSQWLGQNGDPAGLVIPAGFGAAYANKTPLNVTVFVNPEDQLSSGVTEGSVQGVANAFNLRAAGGRPFIGVHANGLGSTLFNNIDYLIPGLIGFTIVTSPMFAMVEISSTYKKERLFRQLSLTPLTKGEWLLSKILFYIALTFVSAAMMIGFGTVVFHAHVTLNIAVLPFLFVGPLFFVSLGMLAGSVAKTPESAGVIGNIITFPMMFLSGTFFPVSSFSPALKTFAHILPLFYVIDGMNQVLLFGNLGRAAVDLAIVFVGASLLFVAAIVAFKWRDE
ncbi:MAG: ABC transporter permease [Thermoplasmata archaeon]|nr:ABC transporter permease [Thermoplasmata archaeon]